MCSSLKGPNSRWPVSSPFLDHQRYAIDNLILPRRHKFRYSKRFGGPTHTHTHTHIFELQKGFWLVFYCKPTNRLYYANAIGHYIKQSSVRFVFRTSFCGFLLYTLAIQPEWHITKCTTHFNKSRTKANVDHCHLYKCCANTSYTHRYLAKVYSKEAPGRLRLSCFQ